MRPSFAALIALPLILAACTADAATRAFPVPGFVKLRVEGPYTVRVHTGGSVSVAAHGPQARLDKLMVESRGDTLVISTEKGWIWHGPSWGAKDNVTIDISVPMLEAAELTGSGDVSVDHVRGNDFSALLTGSGDLSIGRLETSRLRANVNGSGDLTIAGHTGRAEASVEGSGDLHAGGLTVGLLTTSVTGSGDASFGATTAARGSLIGSGDISIAGHPTCQIHKTGSGDVKCGG